MGGPGSGRRPVPTLRLVHDGGTKSHRHSKTEPKPALKMPEPPAEIVDDPEAFAEWKRVGAQLYALGIISELDRATFAAYCFAAARYLSAERAVRAEAVRDSKRRGKKRIGAAGLLVFGAAGQLVKNPAVRIVEDAARQMRQFADSLGLTPSGRSKIKTDQAPNVEEDEEDELD